MTGLWQAHACGRGPRTSVHEECPEPEPALPIRGGEKALAIQHRTGPYGGSMAFSLVVVRENTVSVRPLVVPAFTAKLNGKRASDGFEGSYVTT